MGITKHRLAVERKCEKIYNEVLEYYYRATDLQCEKSRKNFKTTMCYKFLPVNNNSISMLIQNEVYFSDIPSLNDPLECPLRKMTMNHVFFRSSINQQRGIMSRLYCGEAVIKQLVDKGTQVDLAYLSPPFNSSRDWRHTI